MVFEIVRAHGCEVTHRLYAAVRLASAEYVLTHLRRAQMPVVTLETPCCIRLFDSTLVSLDTLVQHGCFPPCAAI